MDAAKSTVNGAKIAETKNCIVAESKWLRRLMDSHGRAHAPAGNMEILPLAGLELGAANRDIRERTMTTGRKYPTR